MISHQYQCIYIHIPKCAGTTIETLFDDITGHHNNWQWYQQNYPQEFIRYYKFAFVRNTWDWLVSEYEYWSNVTKATWFHSQEDHNAKVTYERWFNSEVSSFDHLIELLPEFSLKGEVYPHFLPQHSFIFNAEGKLCVDYVGYINNFQRDLALIQKRIRSTFSPSVKINALAKKHYSTYYSNSQVQKVSDLYHKDIKLFNFVFDDQR